MLLKKKKKLTAFRSVVYSRHPSHRVLRTMLPLMPFRSLIRLGSTTDKEDTVTNGGKRIEINTIQAIKNSASKLLMKQSFTAAGVKTADWSVIRQGATGLSWCNYDFHNKVEENRFDSDFRFWENDGPIEEQCPLSYPIVAKHIFGSRGTGNTLLKDQEALQQWLEGKNLSNYIFEKYYNYGLEFRLHITEDGCFYTCRKALKSDTPEDKKWFRNDSNSVWFLESNELFNKPNSWEDIVDHCVKALKSIGADVLSFDVRVQSAKNNKGEDREYQDFILVECNSASSMDSDAEGLSICAQKYLEELPKLLTRKYNKYRNEL